MIESVESDARVMKGKMLLSMKNWELDALQQILKARFVVMGNVVFDKFMKVRRSRPDSDFWAALVSLAGLGFVQARAVAHKRRAQNTDLYKAYTQVVLGGVVPS